GLGAGFAQEGEMGDFPGLGGDAGPTIKGVSGLATRLGFPRARARIWWTPSAVTSAVLATGRRPSALRRVVRPISMLISTACASTSSGVSRRPRTGAFPSETTRHGGGPRGNDRRPKPHEGRGTAAGPRAAA